MDSQTGDLYSSKKAAQDFFERARLSEKERNDRMNDIVEISGSEKAVKSISDAVKAAHRRKDKVARNSRKKNRKK